MRQKKKKNPVWVTADGRRLVYSEIGDNHLVNILQCIESNLGLYGSKIMVTKLPPDRMVQYPELVIEAVRRGLFNWSAERKHLDHNTELIRKGV